MGELPARDEFGLGSSEAEPAKEIVRQRLMLHAKEALITANIADRLGRELDPRDSELINSVVKASIEAVDPADLEEVVQQADEQIKREMPLSPERHAQAEQIEDVLLERVQETIRGDGE